MKDGALPTHIETGATFSPCRNWRYSLWRIWDPERAPLLCILLNPSTADETENDPTVTRCQQRAQSGEFGGILIGNIFALRSTDPSVLYKSPDPIGPENDLSLASMRDRLDKEFEKADKRRRKEGIYVPLTSGSAWIFSQSGIPGVSHFFFGDIAKLCGHQILDVLEMEPGELDLVVGGPPCQGFTRANHKAGPNDPRNELVFEFARVTLELHPKAFCMENVPEVARMKTPEGLLVMDALKLAIESGSMKTLYALRNFLRGNPGVSCAVVGKPNTTKEAPAPKVEDGPLFRWKSKEKR